MLVSVDWEKIVKPRILFIVAADVVGGHELQVLRMCETIQSSCEITVCSYSTEVVAFFERNGFQSRVVGLRRLTRLKVIGGILSSWGTKNEYADIVGCSDLAIVSCGAIEAAAAFSLLGNMNNVYLYMPALNLRSSGRVMLLYNQLLMLIVGAYKRLITINKIQRALFIRAGCRQEIYIVRNRLVAHELQCERQDRDERIIFIGRFDANKRISQLLEWIDDPLCPVREVVLIGEGPERLHLEDVAKKARVAKISFLGRLDLCEQNAVLSRSDILVLNSISEGEPLVIRECLARGMKVLVRDIAGVKGVTQRCERFATQTDFYKCLSSVKDRKVGRKINEKYLAECHQSQLRRLVSLSEK